ncbi:hypothetical protein AAAU22_07500 [[Clostridium] symbiosum]|uniref:hypothetical protein n=1 Tax=Clostridium symbiosum TaxID=1512 RepID=UPI0032C02637
MSNKSTGTKFEREFAALLAEHWFWVHLFQDNKNGQPCDVIAARNGTTYLFDCKACSEDRFFMSRMRENQYNAMELFRITGNGRGMMAIRFPGGEIYLLDYLVLKSLVGDGVKRIGKDKMTQYARPLNNWLEELEGPGCLEDRDDADCDWK